MIPHTKRKLFINSQFFFYRVQKYGLKEEEAIPVSQFKEESSKKNI